MSQCRYENVNRSALLDAQLFDKIGRVRSPSVGTFTGSEDGSVPDVATFVEDEALDADEDYSLPHQVYVLDDDTEH